jgi:hypothetical protein
MRALQALARQVGSGTQIGQYRQDAAVVVGCRRGKSELQEDARDVLGNGGLGDDEPAGDRRVRKASIAVARTDADPVGPARAVGLAAPPAALCRRNSNPLAP